MIRKILSLLFVASLGTLSAEADDAKYVYADAMTVNAGDEVTLSVKMLNDSPISGYQYDLVLPEGMTVVTDEDEFPMVFLSTARTTPAKMNFFDQTLITPSHLRVLCYSSKGYSFSGNDGEVTLVTIKVDENMTSGTYDLRFEDIQLSYSSDSYDTALKTIPITVVGRSPEAPASRYDVNQDGKVTIADVNELIDYLLQHK